MCKWNSCPKWVKCDVDYNDDDNDENIIASSQLPLLYSSSCVFVRIVRISQQKCADCECCMCWTLITPIIDTPNPAKKQTNQFYWNCANKGKVYDFQSMWKKRNRISRVLYMNKWMGISQRLSMKWLRPQVKSIFFYWMRWQTTGNLSLCSEKGVEHLIRNVCNNIFFLAICLVYLRNNVEVYKSSIFFYLCLL